MLVRLGRRLLLLELRPPFGGFGVVAGARLSFVPGVVEVDE